MTIVYFLIAAGLSAWLWIIRPKLLEKEWFAAESWALNASIGAAFVALMALVGRQQINGIGDLLIGVAIFAFLVNLARHGWHWVAVKAGVGVANKNHLRGALVVDERAVAKQLKHVPSRFSVGAVPVPVKVETTGFLIAGSTGTGKSHTITRALDALRSDGALAVIADASGIYASRYYDERRGDVVLNPFDSRCVPWSPLCELETVADVPALAKSLVPDGEGSAAEWNSYAQTFVEAVLEHCLATGLGNGELFRILAVADIEELREVCAGTPAQPLLADGNERMFGSIRGIASSSAKFLQHLDPDADLQNGFSIRRYLHSDRSGYLFLSYQQDHRNALKSMIACCVDVASRAVLSLPPSPDRRVIFALDEMPLLGKIQSILDLATNGRKHGAVLFVGLQDIAQLRELYGRNNAQTLISNLKSKLTLCVGDGETAEYMSFNIGDEEKTRMVKSGGKSHQSMQMSGVTSENWQEQVVKDRVVLPSELMNLPNMRGFFKLSEFPQTAVVNLQPAEVREVAEAFIPAPPRVRKKPPVKQQERKQAGGTSLDSSAEIDSLDLL